jgi:hypothetical protein
MAAFKGRSTVWRQQMEFSIQNKNGKLGKMVSNSQCAEILLARKDIFELDGHPNKTSIKCLDGTLWITQNNDPEDYFIKKGQSFTATHNGRVLIQGLPLGKARVSIQ